MASTVQISTHVARSTKARLDAIVRMTGRSRKEIIENAILHEAMALEEIPEEFMVPTRIQLNPEEARRLLEVVDRPNVVGETMRRALRAIGVTL